jgi:hypothetical protein
MEVLGAGFETSGRQGEEEEEEEARRDVDFGPAGGKAKRFGGGGAGAHAASGVAPYPLKPLLRLIYEIYEAKRTADEVDARENNPLQTMPEFFYDFFLNKCAPGSES